MLTLFSLKNLYSDRGAAGGLFIVAAFVFGWMPSARERAPRLVAVVAVGLRRLRRFNVRARTALVRLLHGSVAPQRGQRVKFVLAVPTVEALAGGARGRRCQGQLGVQLRP